MPYKDPEKRKEYKRKYRKEKPEVHRKSNRESQRKHSQWFYELKQTLSCEICGESKWQCLDFHHHKERVQKEIRNGKTIRLTISTLVARSSKEKVLEAIKECRVLCANCHRMEHWNDKNNPDS